MFGTLSLLNFIVTNDLDIFKKLIPGQIKQIFKQDSKITLLRWNFKLKSYENLMQKELNRLSTRVRHFFKFPYDFGRYKKIWNTVKVVKVDNNLQSFKTDYCGLFQMYFYLNLFEPIKGSVVAELSSKKLNVKQIDALLNKMLTQELNRTKGYWMPSYCSTTSSSMEKRPPSPTKIWSQNQKIKPPVKLIFSL